MDIAASNAPNLSDLNTAISDSFNLPVEGSADICLYTSDHYDAQPLTQLKLDSTRSSKLYARSSVIRCVEYAGEVRFINCPPSFRPFFDLRDYLRKYLEITNVPKQHLELYQKTPKGTVKLDLSRRVPKMDED